MDIDSIEKELYVERGQMLSLKKRLKEVRRSFKLLSYCLSCAEEAREIIQAAAKETQSQIQYRVSNLVSLALRSVFEESLSFEVNFVPKRGRTEAILSFVDTNGNKLDPMSEVGGGVNDVAAFALRVCVWSLQKNRIANTIVLDEPFKHLKGEDENKRALQLVQTLSHRLNVQIIMISDERIPREDSREIADRLFSVVLKTNGVSKVTQE